MTTVTFGLKDSPYLAIRSLHEIAKLIGNKYPRAANAILKCFYVDDYTGGADSVEEALLTYNEMKKAFDEFGFNLRKLVSNSAEFLKYIPECDKEEKNKSFVKTLGIPWDPENDEFVFKVNLNLLFRPETKRQLASEIAVLQYDPLGWIAPVIVKAKILLQDVWQLKKENKKAYDWDDKLPSEIIDSWMNFKSRLGALDSIKLQRWLGTTPCTHVELHAFCDACKKALAACVYIRFVNQNNEIRLLLIAAKTKNAPIIEQTTPKLELCAAVLLVKLVKSVRKMMNLNVEKTVMWSDSKVALAWIAANPQKYKKFVASRITKINKLKNVQWCHIPGVINPADCASRGIFGDELTNHPLWWNGPQFLREKIDYEVQSEDIIETKNERKMTVLLITSEEKSKSNHFVDNAQSILPDISSWKKLKRVFAYVNRFIDCLKKKKTEKKGAPITANEIENATTTIIRVVQSEYYEKEINEIESMKNISKTSELLNLNVFMDKKRVLRVGGRIVNHEIPFEVKHPILIPKKSVIAKLIIRDMHETNFHAGPKLTESIIRKQFWIINGQTTIKKQLKNCVVCRKYRPKTSHQMMGNLPTTRTTVVDKPFTNTMVDFTGAIFIKTSKIRNAKIIKAYICIFICMATKAIHVELVSDMTGEAFIASLRRFIARRGAVKTLNSDNGTNFVAANRLLKELGQREMNELNEEVVNELASQGITWKFSPPAAPHFNGLVEAGVKTVKGHLMKALNGIILTFEEMATVLAQIESAVNSRPLTPVSCDVNDNTVLTPAHFLLNSSPMAIASENLDEHKINYLDRWRRVQQIVRNFWRQWQDEYLHTIQQRKKWQNPVNEVKQNDLVLIRNEAAPVGKWPMGRIVEVHPGKDGLIRVATIKTSQNTLVRPVTKLAPLPIDNLVNNEVSISSNAEKETKKTLVEPQKMGKRVAALLLTVALPQPVATQKVNDMEWHNGAEFQLIIMLLVGVSIFSLFIAYLVWIWCRGRKQKENMTSESAMNVRQRRDSISKRVFQALTAFLAFLAIEATPIDAEAQSKAEIAEKLFGHLMEIYKSETTKVLVQKWKTKDPEIPQFDSVHPKESYATQNDHASEYKWFIIIGVLVVALLAILIMFCIMLIMGRTEMETKSSEMELNPRTVNRPTKEVQRERSPIDQNPALQMCQQAHTACEIQQFELSPIVQNAPMQMCQQAHSTYKNEEVDSVQFEQQQAIILTDQQLHFLVQQFQKITEQKMKTTVKMEERVMVHTPQSLSRQNENSKQEFINILA